MKKILSILILLFLLTSCEDKGVTSQKLTRDESTFPYYNTTMARPTLGSLDSLINSEKLFK
jgi:PBP1b-binding outer membrane lipoprotein LpoB